MFVYINRKHLRSSMIYVLNYLNCIHLYPLNNSEYVWQVRDANYVMSANFDIK